MEFFGLWVTWDDIKPLAKNIRAINIMTPLTSSN